MTETEETTSDQSAPDPVNDTISTIGVLLENHHGSATASERFAKMATTATSRPVFLAVLSMMIIGWLSINFIAARLGVLFDPPPYPLLQTILGIGSLVLVVLVLGAQRREDLLDEKIRYLNLQLALINEQKTAKIIRLLEEMRKDSPHIPDRVDLEANAMASPANPIQAMQDRLADGPR